MVRKCKKVQSTFEYRRYSNLQSTKVIGLIFSDKVSVENFYSKHGFILEVNWCVFHHCFLRPFDGNVIIVTAPLAYNSLALGFLGDIGTITTWNFIVKFWNRCIFFKWYRYLFEVTATFLTLSTLLVILLFYFLGGVARNKHSSEVLSLFRRKSSFW